MGKKENTVFAILVAIGAAVTGYTLSKPKNREKVRGFLTDTKASLVKWLNWKSKDSAESQPK